MKGRRTIVFECRIVPLYQRGKKFFKRGETPLGRSLLDGLEEAKPLGSFAA
jgi:hypothetical protein